MDTPKSFPNFSLITTPSSGISYFSPEVLSFKSINSSSSPLFSGTYRLTVCLFIPSLLKVTDSWCILKLFSYPGNSFKVSLYFSISVSVGLSPKTTIVSYFHNLSNCFSTIPVFESLSPKPVTRSAIHPAIPKIVISIRCLYLNIFLNVTF